MPSTFFTTTPSWRATYPGASAGILAVRGANNPVTHSELEQRKQTLEAALRERFSGLSRAEIEALPTVQAYNAYYKPFKKTYHVQLQLESIAFKGKSIPSVAALVEAMFMAEIKNQLLTAGHDLDRLQLPVTLDVAQGTEQYTLMRGQEQVLKVGDMFMADELGILSSILYGPDQRSQITAETRNALFTVYAPPGIAPETVQAHLEDLRDNVLLIAPQAEVLELHVFSA